MSREDKILDSISAYVDGELEPAAAARVAQLIASDEKVARQAAKLAEIKSAVAGLAEDVVVVPIRPRRSRPARFLPLAFAACLGATIVAGGWLSLSWMTPWPVPQNHTAGLADRDAVSQHDLWVADSLPAGTAPASAPEGLFAPEMTAAGLTLALLREDVTIDGRRAIQAGYVGRKGCRLSLFRIAGIQNPQEFRLTSDGGLLRASWTGPSARYLLVARGMDEARFAVIAGVIRSIDRHDERPDDDNIASLEAMRQPCIG